MLSKNVFWTDCCYMERINSSILTKKVLKVEYLSKSIAQLIFVFLNILHFILLNKAASAIFVALRLLPFSQI